MQKELTIEEVSRLCGVPVQHLPSTEYKGCTDIRFAFHTRKTERQRLLRLIVFERSEGFCGICGDRLEFRDMDIDHIKPSKRGGVDDISNMQAAHYTCNTAKGNKEKPIPLPRKATPPR